LRLEAPDLRGRVVALEELNRPAKGSPALGVALRRRTNGQVTLTDHRPEGDAVRYRYGA
jgi:hypothetical protein